MGGLYILFIAVPLLELWILIEVGSRIGTVPTIGLVVVTAILGASLARWQGLSALERMRTMSQAGKIPAEPVFDGILILLAAALLLTPGILTDLIGFALLVPLTRRIIRAQIRKRIEVVEGPDDRVGPERPSPGGRSKVIDQDGKIVE
jgi:UPF0716 protein FxsA